MTVLHTTQTAHASNALSAFDAQCRMPVWRSTSELGYAEPFVNLNAIEQTQEWKQPRVDGVESPRHRADAATETEI